MNSADFCLLNWPDIASLTRNEFYKDGIYVNPESVYCKLGVQWKPDPDSSHKQKAELYEILKEHRPEYLI